MSSLAQAGAAEAIASLKAGDPSLRQSSEGSRLDVLFVDLPFTTYEMGRRFKEAWSRREVLSAYELHLGFRYLAAALRQQGFSAEILFPSEENGLRSHADLGRAILARAPRILGFTTYEGSLGELVGFIRRLKRAGLPSLICLGGHLATFSAEDILRDFPDAVDVIVLGEGEETLRELAGLVAGGRSFTHVRGIACRGEDGGIVRSRRPPVADVNALPFPTIPENGHWRGQGQEVPLFVTTSRGCYGHCSFCRSSHLSDGWRPRDPVNVADELEAACARGISLFEFVDDNFIGPGAAGKRRAARIVEEIQRRRLKIRFHASCRVNDVDEPTIRLLQSGGLISLSLGVESGVPRMLECFNKGIRPAQSLAAVQLLDRLEVPTLVYIIFFDPYMTLAEVGENLEFLRQMRDLEHVRFEEIIFRKLIPVSGTELFDRIRQDGLLRGDYVSGHSFVFQDRRVGLLADFLERIDLRFERVMQRDAFRRTQGLYSGFKENFEFLVAERALPILCARKTAGRAARELLDAMLGQELRDAFRPAARPAPAAVPCARSEREPEPSAC